MRKAIFRRRSIAVLLTTLATVGAIAAYTTATASADGRTIVGNFCLSDHLFCMSAGLDGQTPVENYGVSNGEGTCAPPPATDDSGPGFCVPNPDRVPLVLRPGTYWITVTDDQTKHNFALRSCPGSTSPCTDTNPDATSADGQAITLVPFSSPDPVTMPFNLKPGWYRLYCQSDNPVDHEAAGMYVDIEVGGVGQVG
jgi:hypothetical protein